MTESRPPPPDPAALARILAGVSARLLPQWETFLQRFRPDKAASMPDRLDLGPAYAQFLGRLWSDPVKIIAQQTKFWQDWTQLCQAGLARIDGGEAPTLYAPDRNDRRFRAAAWTENPAFDFIKQSYLMGARWLDEVTRETSGLDPAVQAKVEFFNRQLVNAAAPGNFLLTNPEALQATLDSNGESLVRGFENFMADIERGDGVLKISTNDAAAFRLGDTLAATPGKVIFENDMMQLIQYAPATETVFARPLLIVPPWINKYYVLDLQAANSMIGWLAGQGHTVFVISWVNPGRGHAEKTFDDYLTDGVLATLDEIRSITGMPDCNVAGYCLGGTLLAVTLAWLAAKGQGDRVAAATLLAAMVDFEHAGDMKLFIDEAQLARLDAEMRQRGFLPADFLRETFAVLRANDLIWSFVINNYLLGRDPVPFDLLYWNDDATNMPASMHGFYLRKCYLENVLCRPDGVTIAGVPIDVRKIATPVYFLSAREDHIAPWRATYAATQLFAGPVCFTLAASGHVAGIVNPPSLGKYYFWTAAETPETPDAWLQNAARQDGSWWPHWAAWLASHGGERIAARPIGENFIEDAPGRYVTMASES